MLLMATVTVAGAVHENVYRSTWIWRATEPAPQGSRNVQQSVVANR